MTGLQVIYSTMMEKLVERFALKVSEARDPLKPLIVITQTDGLQKWLQLETARLNAVTANVAYRSPRKFISHLSRDVLGMEQELSPYSKKILRWSIFKILFGDLEHDQILKNYTKGKQLRMWELSCKIADIFDQYFMYRPNIIRSWNKGVEVYADVPSKRHELWQLSLWKKLKESNANIDDPVQIHDKIIARIVDDKTDIIRSKIGTVYVFGISSLAPGHLDILNALSGRTKVVLYMLNPSKEYWVDIISEKKKAGLNLKESQVVTSLYETTNELLASMGKVGQEFLNELLKITDDLVSLDEGTSIPHTLSALDWMQNDINTLAKPDLDKTYTITDVRDSLEVSICHNQLREIEVLHDKLLEAFDKDKDLNPSDVIVMTPDIDDYTPIIDAVFRKTNQIPYTIADRSLISEYHETKTFVDLLNIIKGRFGYQELLELIDSVPVREKFKISDVSFAWISEWFKKSAFRWGINAKHTTEIAGFELKGSTWDDLKQSLMLGYCMQYEGIRGFNSIYPNPNVSQKESIDALSDLLTMMDKFAELAGLCNCKKRTNEWVVILNKILNDFFPCDNYEFDVTTILRAIKKLENESASPCFEEPVSIDVIISYFEEAFYFTKSVSSFLSGKLTFCSMIPMRSVPAKLICIIGMNDHDFPRKEEKIQFDLCINEKKPLDRSIRDNDRYLFLEALLSARKKLYISYVGRDIVDGKEKEPSQLVHELLDYACDRFKVDKKAISTEYPLHSFSKKYLLEGSRLVTYSVDPLVHIKELAKAEVPNLRVSDDKIPKKIVISPHELASFFKNPIKIFLQKQLGVYYPSSINVPEKESVFGEINALERYKIRRQLLLSDHKKQDLEHYLQSQGDIPLGELGDMYMQQLETEVQKRLKRLRGLIGALPKTSVTVSSEFNIGDRKIHVAGEIDDVYGHDLVFFTSSDEIKEKDKIYIWIHHLLMLNEGINSATKMISDKIAKSHFEFGGAFNARTELEKIVQYYVEGLSKPVLFIPPLSFLSAEGKGMGVIRIEYHNPAEYEGSHDVDDPYIEQIVSKYDLFEEGAPFNDEFATTANDILKPLMENFKRFNEDI